LPVPANLTDLQDKFRTLVYQSIVNGVGPR